MHAQSVNNNVLLIAEIDLDVDDLLPFQVDKLNLIALDYGVQPGAYSKSVIIEKAVLPSSCSLSLPPPPPPSLPSSLSLSLSLSLSPSYSRSLRAEKGQLEEQKRARIVELEKANQPVRSALASLIHHVPY